MNINHVEFSNILALITFPLKHFVKSTHLTHHKNPVLNTEILLEVYIQVRMLQCFFVPNLASRPPMEILYVNLKR